MRNVSLLLVLVVGFGAIGFGPTAAVGQSGEDYRLLDTSTYLEMEAIGGLQISPDGGHVLFTRGWVDKMEDRTRNNLLDRRDGQLAGSAAHQRHLERFFTRLVARRGEDRLPLRSRRLDPDPRPLAGHPRDRAAQPSGADPRRPQVVARRRDVGVRHEGAGDRSDPSGQAPGISPRSQAGPTRQGD